MENLILNARQSSSHIPAEERQAYLSKAPCISLTLLLTISGFIIKKPCLCHIRSAPRTELMEHSGADGVDGVNGVTCASGMAVGPVGQWDL